tara:strand:- start:502 stop:633 length:132 start_codon:yes stop_codon:yes gene_type:complete
MIFLGEKVYFNQQPTGNPQVYKDASSLCIKPTLKMHGKNKSYL